MFDFLKGIDRLNNNIYCAAIIVAAGSSSRMEEIANKQYARILGKPVLAYTIDAFENCDLISEIIIVVKEEDIIYCSDIIVRDYGFTKVKKIVAGGKERQHSVSNGLKELSPNTDIVLIHDGARPLVCVDDIENSVHECIEHKAVAVGVRTKDTIKIVDENGFVAGTPERSSLWIIQTPQVFKYKIINDAYKSAIEDNYIGTDDASLVERIGCKVKVIEGTYQNIKITTDEDFYIVQAILDNELLQ